MIENYSTTVIVFTFRFLIDRYPYLRYLPNAAAMVVVDRVIGVVKLKENPPVVGSGVITSFCVKPESGAVETVGPLTVVVVTGITVIGYDFFWLSDHQNI